MKRASVRLAVLGFLLAVGGCGPDTGHLPIYGRDGGVGGGPADGGYGAVCEKPPADSDGDGISDADEGASQSPPVDTDGDGTPDFRDADSDGDGLPDAVEGRTTPCAPPVDSDGDGTPDFRDADSDSSANATVGDAEEAGPDPSHPVDSDGDGLPDYLDPDNDGDGISDQFELTADGQAVAALTLAAAPDTDGDGLPDFLDEDSDADGILDRDESAIDTDGDGTPNYRDLDSDGDCVPDASEAGDANPQTPPADTDGDNAPDFLDRDADADGLLDTREDVNCNGLVDACETDRVKVDTDGDGVNDLIEVEDCAVKSPAVQQQTMCLCDGADAAQSPLSHGDFVFVVDYQKPPVPTVETLSLSTDVSQADVLFALDSTASMQGALTNLAKNLGNYVPNIRDKVKDIAFGVLDFKDFGLHSEWVVQYDYRITSANTLAGQQAVQASLGTLTAVGGDDFPEAGWEALYTIAGGPHLIASGWDSALDLTKIAPIGAAIPAGETQGTVGGAGFRQGSVPIIVTATDASWHDAPGIATNGEDGINDYGVGNSDCSATACKNVPSRATTVQLLQSLGIHVMGLAGSGNGAEPNGNPKGHAAALAMDTGAVVYPSDFGLPKPAGPRPDDCAVGQCCTAFNGAGEAPVKNAKNEDVCPLSFAYDNGSGNGVSESVVSGIVALANSLTFDIHVVASDVDAGAVDHFIDKLVPNLSGAGAASLCITTTPSPLGDNFTGPKALTGKDGVNDTFPGIGGGKLICFDVIPKTNTAVPNTDQPQFFRAQLQVKGDTGKSIVNLGTPRDVFFLVPPVIQNGPIN